MKALIDIPDPLIPALAALCEQEKISRSEAVRRSIEKYVSEYTATPRTTAERKKALLAAFGAWRGTESECDGVQLQRRLRAEWAHRDPDT